MTFSRIFPVIQKLQVLFWIGVGSAVVGVGALIVFSMSSPSVSQTQDSAQGDGIEQKLKNIRAEASSLREKLGESTNSKKSVASSHSEPPMIVGLNRFNSGGSLGGGDSGGFQKVAASKASEVYIPMGSVFRAQLIMPIKTSVQDTFVMAQTTHEYRFDSDQVRSIPSGSRVIGRAQLNPLLKGVAVRFHTLVTPKGIEYPINLLALSNELFAEVNGVYFSNDVETYGAILAFGAIGGFANASQSTDSRFIVSTPNKNVSNLVWGSVGGASFRMADELIRKIQERNVEYVIVPSGEKIFLALQERFVIKDKKPIR